MLAYKDKTGRKLKKHAEKYKTAIQDNLNERFAVDFTGLSTLDKVLLTDNPSFRNIANTFGLSEENLTSEFKMIRRLKYNKIYRYNKATGVFG